MYTNKNKYTLEGFKSDVIKKMTTTIEEMETFGVPYMSFHMVRGLDIINLLDYIPSEKVASEYNSKWGTSYHAGDGLEFIRHSYFYEGIAKTTDDIKGIIFDFIENAIVQEFKKNKDIAVKFKWYEDGVEDYYESLFHPRSPSAINDQDTQDFFDKVPYNFIASIRVIIYRKIGFAEDNTLMSIEEIAAKASQTVEEIYHKVFKFWDTREKENIQYIDTGLDFKYLSHCIDDYHIYNEGEDIDDEYDDTEETEETEEKEYLDKDDSGFILEVCSKDEKECYNCPDANNCLNGFGDKFSAEE